MELRKRKEVITPAAPPPKRSNPVSKSKKAAAPTAAEIEADAKGESSDAPPVTASIVDDQPEGAEASAPPAEATTGASTTTVAGADVETEAGKPPRAKSSSTGPPKQGDVIDLEGFGGKVSLDDGSETSFEELVKKSGKGIVIFTYPKASTPGCTKQACLFRDAHKPLTSSSYAIYGLSRDTPKSNASFRAKQSLPYNLICDVDGSLLKALGFAKAPKSAVRGVVVVDRTGKVLGRVEGGPDATLEAARKLIEAGSEGDVEGGAKAL